LYQYGISPAASAVSAARLRLPGASRLRQGTATAFADAGPQLVQAVGRAARMLARGLASGQADLGRRLFTAGWWLQLASLGLLIGAALLAAGRVPPIMEAAPPLPTPAQADGARADAIAPLALGARAGDGPHANARLMRPLAEPPERPRVERSLTIGRRGLAAALRAAGVGADDVRAVQALLPGLSPDASARAELVLGRRDSRAVPRPLEALALRAAFDLKVEISRANGALVAQRIPIPVDDTPLRVTGAVGRSLDRALRAAGVPAAQAGEFVRQMRYVVDFQRGLGRRDQFDIIIEQRRAEIAPGSSDVRHGKLLYGAIRAAGGKDVEIGLHGSEYFTASGEGVKRGLMKTPVAGGRMTSGFGMRLHPLLGFSRMHQGVDFGAAHGEPIMAAAGGTVSFAGWHGGHGNYVMLRHTGELATAYGHMAKILVKPGQRVRQGDVIGHVGSTGLSTGPHLHYEVWLRGKPVNPVSLRFVGGSELTGSALAEFRRQMAGWRSVRRTSSPAG
jgi:murein DD-endopeptidase MepM/ murein hydrolase activator NlpD